MQTLDDMALVREYAARNSEVAFETLMVEKVKQAICLGERMRRVRRCWYLAENCVLQTTTHH